MTPRSRRAVASGRETVTYVNDIYTHDITYRLLSDQRDRRDAATTQVEENRKAARTP